MLSWINKMFDRIRVNTPAYLDRRFLVVRDVIRGIWRNIDASAKDNRNKVRSMNKAISRLAKQVKEYAKATTSKFRHVYRTEIPKRIKASEKSTRSWARKEDLTTRARAESRLLDEGRRLDRRIDSARGFTRNVRDWASERMAVATAFVNGLVKSLAHVLNGPRALAGWLVGSMASELWRFVLRNELSIGRWVRDRAVGALLSGAGRIENVIARLF